MSLPGAAAARMVLLDIEGTVSPLAYVHEVMFPFVREEMKRFTAQDVARPGFAAALEQMAHDAGSANLAEWLPAGLSTVDAAAWIVAQVNALMDRDAKVTGLKQLQGVIWEQGFKSGALRSTIFPDVPHALMHWVKSGVQLRIYSSGSVQAQKLFFGHTEAGDLTPLLSGYYDTTTGPKKSAGSYAAIAADSGFAPADILFLSDVVEELDAAHAASLRTGLLIRPGNRETAPGIHAAYSSFEDIPL